MPVVNRTDEQPASETLEQRFHRLDEVWRKETAYQSSSTKIKAHSAFREVVGLGEAVVPLILRELHAKPNLWVWALPEITGENPVATADRGNIAKMAEAWLGWAKAKGIAW